MSLKKLLTIAALPALMLASSCADMHDDLDECPYGLYVRFAYDYNTHRANLLHDHVGHLRLYVYDENGRKVTERLISNSDYDNPLADHSLQLFFPNDELPPGHTYRLQAVALQKHWDDALATPGAKYRLSEGASPSALSIALDHMAPASPLECGHHTVDNSQPLDTLWHTLKVTATEPLTSQNDPGLHRTAKPYSNSTDSQLVTVDHERYTYATVSLMRDTKHLNITMRQVDNPADIHDDEYLVEIIDDNTLLDGDNRLQAAGHVHYYPYAAWTSRFDDDGSINIENNSPTRAAAPLQRTAHYNLMFNRTMMPGEDGQGARLQITNKSTGKRVADISLPNILSEGRKAYDLYNYGSQEYLDREYDYHLDFLLQNGEWQYIYINILSWSHRIDNVTLGGN